MCVKSCDILYFHFCTDDGDDDDYDDEIDALTFPICHLMP